MSANEANEPGNEKYSYQQGAILLKGEIERLRDEQHEENCRRRTHERLQLWFNGLLLFTTAVAAGIAAYQGYLTRLALEQNERVIRQTGEQVIAAKQSADADTEAAKAAKVSADAAGRSVRLTEQAMRSGDESFRIQERPYAFPMEISLKEGIQSDKRTRFVIQPGNSGKTPALNVRIFTDVSVGQMPTGNHRITGTSQASDQVTLAANTRLESNFWVVLDRASVVDIESGKRTLAIRGTMIYSDIFKKTHRSWFCAYWHREDRVFRFCPEGNAVE